MKSLLWKEWRENIKWLPLPALLILGPIGIFGPGPLMDEVLLLFVGLVAIVFGAALGFVQIYFESRGDKRSLLLHRPLSSTRIFLAKTLVGVALYLVAMCIPFACVVWMAATPGHISQPFEWPVIVPWSADVLSGLVFYFAGMLTAQRDARWYGSRCLGLAAAVFGWFLVWIVPEFRQALLVILVVGGLMALAAWGSFHRGGAYGPQPLVTRAALLITFLMGLSFLSFTANVFIGGLYWAKGALYHRLDRQGNVLLVQQAKGHLHLTDLTGRTPPEIAGVPLDDFAFRELTAPRALGGGPKARSYRNTANAFVRHSNHTEIGNEWWWFVPSKGVLLGFDKPSKQPIGSCGPGGFARSGEEPNGRFDRDLLYSSRLYSCWSYDYLAFANAVYKVDFRKRAVQSIFVPAKGEQVLWASHWENEKSNLALGFVATDRSIHVIDDAGARLVSIPMVPELDCYEIGSVGRLENPTRYWVWYEPAWYNDLATLETADAYIAMYDDGGREISPRQVVPPKSGFPRDIKPHLPLVEPSAIHAWSGVLTSPVEASLLVGTMEYLLAQVRESGGRRMDGSLQALFAATQQFFPAVRWYAPTHPELVYGFASLLLLSGIVSAVVCLLLARRFAFFGTRCGGWTLMGFCFGWMGLLLMLAIQEWPARVVCPKCGKLRVVTRRMCEHCGADHAMPATDGTEIFEPEGTAAALSPVTVSAG
jgi:hypothetical protein